MVCRIGPKTRVVPCTEIGLRHVKDPNGKFRKEQGVEPRRFSIPVTFLKIRIVIARTSFQDHSFLVQNLSLDTYIEATSHEPLLRLKSGSISSHYFHLNLPESVSLGSAKLHSPTPLTTMSHSHDNYCPICPANHANRSPLLHDFRRCRVSANGKII